MKFIEKLKKRFKKPGVKQVTYWPGEVTSNGKKVSREVAEKVIHKKIIKQKLLRKEIKMGQRILLTITGKDLGNSKDKTKYSVAVVLFPPKSDNKLKVTKDMKFRRIIKPYVIKPRS